MKATHAVCIYSSFIFFHFSSLFEKAPGSHYGGAEEPRVAVPWFCLLNAVKNFLTHADANIRVSCENPEMFLCKEQAVKFFYISWFSVETLVVFRL